MNQNNLKKIVVLTTGGTMAGLSHDPAKPHQYQAAELSGAALMAQFGIDLSGFLALEEVARIDSAEMDEATSKRILDRVQHHLQDPEVHALVVTHGSDTLEETAFLLQTLLQPTKPVVLTCAMRSANHPESDGPRNLKDALALAQQPQDWAGVWVVCAGQVHAPMQVYKAHRHRLDAFQSEGGPVALIVQTQVIRKKSPPAQTFESPVTCAVALQKPWPRVPVVMHHTGGDGQLLDLLVQHSSPLAVLVVGTGNATVSASLEQAIDRARAQGVVIELSSRCPQGGEMTADESDKQKANHLSWPQARLALMLQLLAKN